MVERVDRLLAALIVSVALSSAGCGSSGEAGPNHAGRGRAEVAAVPTRPTSRFVVDSAIPLDEALRRFQAGIAPVRRLEGGGSTREQLVERVVLALERGDTSGLRALEVSRAEFAYLLYPSSIYTHPPFEQAPEIVWMLQRVAGSSGYHRLTERFAGRALGYRGHRCDRTVVEQGANRFWGGCVVTYRSAAGNWRTGRLFGAIVEREGRYKLVNYANDL